MKAVLDYAPRTDRPRHGWIDWIYILLVCLCFTGAGMRFALMPDSPHREDPAVMYANFFAASSAAVSALLFLWGAIDFHRRRSAMPKLVRVAWWANGLVVLVVVIFGPVLYR
jgi:hypothetical protein